MELWPLGPEMSVIFPIGVTMVWASAATVSPQDSREYNALYSLHTASHVKTGDDLLRPTPPSLAFYIESAREPLSYSNRVTSEVIV